MLLVYKVYIYIISNISIYIYTYIYISIADFHMMLSLCYPYDCCWWFDWFRSGEMLINGLLCAVEIHISIGWISLCPIPVPWISTFRNMCSSRFFREQFFCKQKNIWAKRTPCFPQHCLFGFNPVSDWCITALKPWNTCMFTGCNMVQSWILHLLISKQIEICIQFKHTLWQMLT